MTQNDNPENDSKGIQAEFPNLIAVLPYLQKLQTNRPLGNRTDVAWRGYRHYQYLGVFIIKFGHRSFSVDCGATVIYSGIINFIDKDLDCKEGREGFCISWF